MKKLGEYSFYILFALFFILSVFVSWWFLFGLVLLFTGAEQTVPIDNMQGKFFTRELQKNPELYILQDNIILMESLMEAYHTKYPDKTIKERQILDWFEKSGYNQTYQLK